MRFLITWILLAAFWLCLAGVPHGVVTLVFGLASVTLVSAWTSRIFLGSAPLAKSAAVLVRLARYVPWLLWQILVSNVDVLLRVVGLRPIDPRVVSFRPDLESDLAKVAMANSITLTPGTVTIVTGDDEFIVHAIAPTSADLLRSGAMERRLRQVEGREA